MKKLALLIAFIITTTFSFSQNNMVVSAFNYHRNGKLDKAKEAIDKATVHPKTISNAKTWYYRGNIYIDIYNSQDENYKNLDPDALYKAYEAYTKATELDTKKTYAIDIIQRMPIVAQAYFNDGANKYNLGMEANKSDSALAVKEFKNAVNSFEKAYDIYYEAGAIDTLSLYYIAYTANLSHDYELALDKFNTLIEYDYPETGIYSSISKIYLDYKDDAVKSEEYLKLGMQKFPGNEYLLFATINFYLERDKTAEALDLLEVAAELENVNETIFYAIGVQYNKIVEDTNQSNEARDNAFENAVNAYKKALEINPDYFDSNYNMGALYVNKAIAIIEIANQLPLDATEEYKTMNEEAKNYLSLSLPYLEKAHELQPDDISTLGSLKDIYTRLKMYDKMKEINTKLENR